MARKPSKQTSKRKKRPVKRILTTQVLAAGGDAFLDPETGVRLLSWNLAKRPGSKLELADHMPTADLVCVQEAKPSLLPELPGSSHFASSFRGLGPDAEFHGVATLARAQSRDRGHPTAIGSRWREGWVVTPKMALATDYDLGDQKLLVVNVHAYNFQPVFKYMLRDQFERIAERVAAHGGPAVVCGDFNTWRKDRLRLVEVLLHDFEAVEFEDSVHRKKGHWTSRLALGCGTLPLDHVYVRGLGWEEARVLPSEHSDHGALSVKLILP